MTELDKRAALLFWAVYLGAIAFMLIWLVKRWTA